MPNPSKSGINTENMYFFDKFNYIIIIVKSLSVKYLQSGLQVFGMREDG